PTKSRKWWRQQYHLRKPSLGFASKIALRQRALICPLAFAKPRLRFGGARSGTLLPLLGNGRRGKLVDAPSPLEKKSAARSEALLKSESFQHSAGQALTAPARKGEGVQHDGTDLFIELLAHEGAGAMQSGLHRLRLEPKQVGGLLHAQAFDHAGDKDGAVDIGKRVGRLFDEPQDLSLCHSALRIIATRPEWKRNE